MFISFVWFSAFLRAGLSAVEAPRATEDLTLWYDKPAASGMNEALPIGNGRLGALIYGGPATDRFVLNEDSLWTGAENPGGASNGSGSYQKLGELRLVLGDGPKPLVTSPGATSAPSPAHDVAASADENRATLWTVPHEGRPVVWQIDYAAPIAINRYTLTCGPGKEACDPRVVEFSASDNGVEWITLDKKDPLPPFKKRSSDRGFTVQNQTAHRFYRLVFAPLENSAEMQIAEITLEATLDQSVTDYRRSLDLATATARTEFTRDGVRHTREAFASAPGQILCVRWSADKPGAITGRVQLRGAHLEATVASGSDLTFTGTLDNKLRYAAQARILHRGGTVALRDDELVLTGCDEATILLAAATDYAPDFGRGYRSGINPKEQIAGQLASSSAESFASLLATHVGDFQALFNRTALNLGASTAEQRRPPTNLRKVGAVTATDPGLEALLFQYGRYLLISCSRPGSLPANLQGLWNDSNTPAWHSDYHANINVQMNYWPAEVANLGECHTPFFDLVISQLPAWRRATTAAPEFKLADGSPSTRGWAIRTSHNISGGMEWKWDKTANAWYAQHFWEHYAFGGDRAFLRDIAYPVMKEVSEFWRDHLKTLPDGRLVVPDGWSPEHGPQEDGVSYNQQIVWDLFNNTAEAASILDIDPEFRTDVLTMRDRLVAPAIGSWGQLLEWMNEKHDPVLDTPNDHHRHTSHLFGVYPGRQISVTRTPELARASRVSLDARGIADNSDVREWSFAWRTALYARLGAGNEAHHMIRQLFANRNTCANLFGLHPPMQIDGNFGVTAGIAEMLLQSHDRAADDAVILQLLPALPADWRTGTVRGLRARDGFTVDQEWRDGHLVHATVTSALGKPCHLRYGNEDVRLTLATGETYAYRPSPPTLHAP